MLSEELFDTGDVVLNYAKGPPSGPPLVLLHGSTGRWQGVQALLPHLIPRWQVYALDLRGHGKSGRVAHRYQVADYTRDIAAFLQHLAEPAVLMGHSLGAVIALAAAAAYPTRTRAAVLLDPPLCFRELSLDARPEIKGWVSWVYDSVQGSPSYDMVIARCREMAPAAAAAEIAALADQVSHVAADTLSVVLEDQLFVDFDLAGALTQMQRPLLVLYGDWAHGALMRDEDVAFVHTRLPSVVSVKIPDGSHMFFEDQQEAVMQQVNRFLSSPATDVV